ncbi:MAG: low temperature requirement protein A [Bacteroidales bacterium]
MNIKDKFNTLKYRYSSVRNWWTPPHKADYDINHRQITGLEIFYDLVYSVYFARIGVSLATDLGSINILIHCLYFILGWWSWLNFTLYFEMHGNDDVRSRFFAFLQMSCVLGMSIFFNSPEHKDLMFTLFYIGLQLIMTYLWWYTGVVHIEHIRSMKYSRIMLIATIVFALGLLFPPPLRYFIWVLSLLVNAYAPHSIQRRNIYVTPSLSKRVNRFTVIIIAQIISSIIVGVWALKDEVGTTSIFIFGGLLLAFFVWTLYSEFVYKNKVKIGYNNFMLYFIFTALLALSISFAGALLIGIASNYHNPSIADVYNDILAWDIFAIMMIIELFQFIMIKKLIRSDLWIKIALPIFAILSLGISLFNNHFWITLISSSVVILVMNALKFFFIRIIVKIEHHHHEKIKALKKSFIDYKSNNRNDEICM